MALRSLLLLALCTLAFSQGVNDNGALPPSTADDVPGATVLLDDTVASYLVSRNDMNVLVKAAGMFLNLTETLANPGARFTVFAPNDNAFANLARRLVPQIQFDQNDPDEIVAALSAGIQLLREVKEAGYPDIRGVLMYHMIGQAFSSIQLEEQFKVGTMSGQDLFFADGVIIDGDDSRGNVTAGPKDVFVQNGWVNVIYEVLLPFDLDKAIMAIENQPVPTELPEVTPTPVAVPTPDDEEDDDAAVPDGDDDDDDDDDDDEDGDEEADESVDPSPEDEESRGDDDPVCFPASATVRLADGSQLAMKELEAGHEIHVDEQKTASAVFLFTHKSFERVHMFHQLTTASGHIVTMTGGHYLYANDRLVSADAVRVGDVLRTVGGNSQVVAVRRVKDVGLYAPHTVHGDMIVNDVVVSGYSRAVHPKVAHALLAPIRALVKWGGFVEPLGSTFYEGADRLARFVPGGKQRY